MSDRRQFIGAGLATFAGILAGRLPSLPPEIIEATIELEDNFTPALQQISQSLPPAVDAIERLRLSLDGCRDIFVSVHRAMGKYAGNDGLIYYEPAGLKHSELALEFWPPCPPDDVLELLVQRVEVDVDCRAVGVPAEIRGYVSLVERDLQGTRIIVVSAGEMIWHG